MMKFEPPNTPEAVKYYIAALFVDDGKCLLESFNKVCFFRKLNHFISATRLTFASTKMLSYQWNVTVSHNKFNVFELYMMYICHLLRQLRTTVYH